ncbi:uncharacterized protein (DUF58 family) [Propioniferax innocua]|uniref:Uncharacterized protein (DUF58 family) n=2 Tax=Propioniferax innocua TaxID=1753 RepID=A0A542ZSR9_9ACTN|nr:uncharacterized protein (DUF58 family) [Propioniferax innocua]
MSKQAHRPEANGPQAPKPQAPMRENPGNNPSGQETPRPVAPRPIRPAAPQPQAPRPSGRDDGLKSGPPGPETGQRAPKGSRRNRLRAFWRRRDDDPASSDRDLGDLRLMLWRWTNRGLVVLVVAVLIVALALLLRYPSLLGIGLALLAALVVETAAVSVAPRLRMERQVEPLVVERHGECHATVRVSTRGFWLVRTRITDRIGRQRVNVEVGGREARYRVPTLRRGLLPIGPMAVHRVGLFGLAMTTQEAGSVEHVRVLPRRVPLTQLAKGRRRSAVGADESVEHGGTDLVGLHEYVAGDDLRRLHWATSARTGMLMIRDDADPSTPHLTVILDDRDDHYADSSLTDTDFEDAVEVAFALAQTAIEEGHPLHLLTTSGSVDVPVSERLGAAQTDARRVHAALAEVQPSTAPAHMRLPKRTLDSVAVISGALAPLPDLTGYAIRGASGAVLIVDSSGDAPVSSRAGAGGGVTVLRGPRSRDLAALWDRTVR